MITKLSANKVTSRLQENMFLDLHDEGGIAIRHVYGHTLAISPEGQERLLNSLLAAKAARDNADDDFNPYEDEFPVD